MVNISEHFNKLDGVNYHYMNRYIKFIGSVRGGCDAKHHILPRSLFPEYGCFKKHPENCVVLSHRQHYIAYWMLAKALCGSHHMATAFFLMSNYGVISSSAGYKSAMALYAARRHMFRHTSDTKELISRNTKAFFRDNPDARRKISEANAGRIISIEHRLTNSKYMSENNPMWDESQRERMRGENNVAKRSDVRDKISKNCWANGLPPWESVRCTEDSLRVWSKAESAYNFYNSDISNRKCSKLAKHVCEPNKTPIYNLHLKLLSGWNPTEDTVWCSKFK
ncbi:hypothetical protein NVP1244A_182 [Vibrio phage 1.244.A._10N.261.54.C3]|nr:hypothetical protein NVP1244A_182 [Vibrio phage 1.244.A._10N.261.54.C3]AUR98810.1 hypothetical protein NVP1255O_182 [Vibrio phage 1.255.O._10N.286.45.F1]